MKTFTLAVVASAALLSGSSVNAMQSFLAKIPNGSLFGKWLGHKDTGYTQFGTDFSSAFEWNERLCRLPFTGATTSMTYGEAFGDPCCTWKVGETPQTITAWTSGSFPTKKTACASSTPAATTATPSTPASTTATSPSSSATTKPSSASKKCTKKLRM